MRVLRRRSLVLGLFLALLGAGAFWATSSLAASSKQTLPSEKTQECPTHCGDEACEGEVKLVTIDGVGTFQTFSTGGAPVVAEFGEPFLQKSGQKTVPIRIASIDGRGFAEGIGETYFWLDASRPVASAIWEKSPGTEFPAVQEMRFHFFYTIEAMPGKIYRSINPAIMRADSLSSFPPPPGTFYRLVKSVDLEEIHHPGVVVGRVLSNELTMGGRRDKPNSRDAREM
jgi:hypothetical protein